MHRTWRALDSAPEDVLVESWGEGVSQLVTEEAEVVGVEGSAYAGAHLLQDLAERIHKLALVADLQAYRLTHM